MIDDKALSEYECKGQMSFSDYADCDKDSIESLVAVSKIFARAIKQMTIAEWKTFVFALTQIRFTQASNKAIIYIDKQKLAHLIGINSDPDHLSVDLNRAIGNLPQDSFLKFADKDKDIYDNGVFITRVTLLKNRVKIKFEEDYLSLFENLQGEYITLWSEDLFNMHSDRSILMYEDMRLHSDTRIINQKIYSTKDIKTLFNIPKSGAGSYMRAKGFNRTEFEHKVLDPVVKDLLQCKMISLQLNQDGSAWEKIKRHGYVVGYKLTWIVSDRPGVVTATEKPQLQEAISKDPRIMKIAKDIVDGRNYKGSKQSADFEQRNDDLDTIALQLQHKQHN